MSQGGSTQKTNEMYLGFMWPGISGAIPPREEKNVNAKPFFLFMSQKKQSAILAFSQGWKYLQKVWYLISLEN